FRHEPPAGLQHRGKHDFAALVTKADSEILPQRQRRRRLFAATPIEHEKATVRVALEKAALEAHPLIVVGDREHRQGVLTHGVVENLGRLFGVENSSRFHDSPSGFEDSHIISLSMAWTRASVCRATRSSSLTANSRPISRRWRSADTCLLHTTQGSSNVSLRPASSNWARTSSPSSTGSSHSLVASVRARPVGLMLAIRPLTGCVWLAASRRTCDATVVLVRSNRRRFETWINSGSVS